MSDSTFQSSVFGNVETGRAEAEIYTQGATDPWAVVWESDSGWEIETFGPPPSAAALESALQLGRQRLAPYINRRGHNPPDGLTLAGFSMWLLEKDQGS